MAKKDPVKGKDEADEPNDPREFDDMPYPTPKTKGHHSSPIPNDVSSTHKKSTMDTLIQLAKGPWSIDSVDIFAEEAFLEEIEADKSVHKLKIRSLIAEILAEGNGEFVRDALLYQNFMIYSRIKKLPGKRLSLDELKPYVSVARAGVSPEIAESREWVSVIEIASEIEEDLRTVYFRVAKAAMEKAPCPSDREIAKIIGTASPTRARSRLQALDNAAFIDIQNGPEGTRKVVVLGLDWETDYGDPDAPLI